MVWSLEGASERGRANLKKGMIKQALCGAHIGPPGHLRPLWSLPPFSQQVLANSSHSADLLHKESHEVGTSYIYNPGTNQKAYSAL